MKKRSSRLSQRLRSGLAIALVPLALLGCSGGVGKGIGPAYITLVPFGGRAGDASTKIFECIPSTVQALLYFTDGSVGDFTGRVTWSTTNAGAASVSNGDIPVNGEPGQFYSKGVLVPAGPGTAVVSANYNGLSSSVIVNVGTPESITIKRIDRNVPVVPTNNATRLGIGTFQDFTVTAIEDGVEKNVENPNDQTWSFDTPDNGVATVSSSGLVTGLSQGGPLNLLATFPTCGQIAMTSITIANVEAVTVQPEFSGNPNLIVGNTEKFFAFADFGNGPEQDVSQQVAFTSSEPDVLSFSSVSGITNLGGAVAPGGPSAVTAIFTAGGATLNSPQLNVTTVDDTLQSITVAPKNVSVVANSIQLQQFTATGTYSSGTSQDVTRGVTWSVDDATIAQISNMTVTAGVANSVGPIIGTTTITATSSTAQVGITDTATLTTTSQ